MPNISKALLLGIVITTIMLTVYSCSKKKQSENIVKDKQEIDVRRPANDSTDIYGKGYFDYRDTIESFHMGYSIPRDSAYKVQNLKAFEDLNLLIAADSMNPGPYLDRANHLQNIHKYREAIKDYDRYIQLNPYNHSAYQNRGTAYERLKQYNRAIWDYQMVLFLKPDDTIANFNKGVVYDVLNETWQAIKEYDTVVVKDPKLAKAYYNRGAAFERVEKYDEAIEDFIKATQLNPQYKEELDKKIDYLNYTYR